MFVDLECFIITHGQSSFDIAYISDRKCWFGLHMALHLCSLRSRLLFFVCFYSLWGLAACSGAPQQNRQLLRLLVIWTSFENSPIYFTKIPLIGQVAPKEAQVNAVIAFSWLKSISQLLLTVLKSAHWHNHNGLFIPWIDSSLRRYEVKLSLVNLRVHFEPPIATQKVTKFPYLLTYLPTTWL